jgi:hypothetical protein
MLKYVIAVIVKNKSKITNKKHKTKLLLCPYYPVIIPFGEWEGKGTANKNDRGGGWLGMIRPQVMLTKS